MKDTSEKFTDMHKCRVCGHEFEVTEELGSYRCPVCTFKTAPGGLKPLDKALQMIDVKKIIQQSRVTTSPKLDGIREFLKNEKPDTERND